MKSVWVVVILCLLFTAFPARAQLGLTGDAPVEITADGETHFEQGVAIADNNVQIHYGDVSIYCDHAEYDTDTRDVLLVGNVRIYSPDGLVGGQRAIYNLQNKQMRALNFAGTYYPMLFRALTFRTLSAEQYRVRGSYLTTDDQSQPDYHMRAKTMRIYKGDRVVFLNSTLYVGKVPVFWFPYLYSSLGNTGFSILPGYYSTWGAFVQTSYAFAYGHDSTNIGTAHLDYRSLHGVAVGFDSTTQIGSNESNQGLFRSYYTYDTKPTKGINSTNPKDTPNNRYRVSWEQHLYLTDDIYATADMTKLSDRNFIQDFYPQEYRVDPQPDNNVSFTQWSEDYTVNLLTRWQMNNFQETVERLPELAWDIKQHEIFKTGLHVDGSNTLGYLERAFDVRNIDITDNKTGATKTTRGTLFPNYSSARFDNFTQISYPKTYFGWLSIIPRAGLRLTAYQHSGEFYGKETVQLPDGSSQDYRIPSTSTINTPSSRYKHLQYGGALFRPVVNVGVESSFKLSHRYDRVQNRSLGLDGLMHVVQPYVNWSLVENLGPKPTRILQFDTVQPTTQTLPITFPDFQAIDAIGSWDIVRLGVRNNLVTRRNNANYQWVTLDNFFDYNFLNPYQPAKIGNLNNLLSFYPSNWLVINTDIQLPLDPKGFTQMNVSFRVQPTRNLQLSVGYQYLYGYPTLNPFGYEGRVFGNDSQIDFFAYYRINDNWSFSLNEQFDPTHQLLQYQRYLLHRDLSAWIASIGGEVLQNEGQQPNYALILMMTLKAAPQVVVPLSYSPSTTPMGAGSSNR